MSGVKRTTLLLRVSRACAQNKQEDVKFRKMSTSELSAEARRLGLTLKRSRRRLSTRELRQKRARYRMNHPRKKKAA